MTVEVHKNILPQAYALGTLLSVPSANPRLGTSTLHELYMLYHLVASWRYDGTCLSDINI